MTGKTIDKFEFYRLLDCQLPREDNVSESSPYEVTDSGVRAKPITDRDYELLVSEERATLLEFELNGRLDFPCTMTELTAWAELQGFQLNEHHVKAIEEESSGELVSKKASHQEAPKECFSNPPKHEDDWFLVIQHATKDFLKENNRCPNVAEIWARLWEKPPTIYSIVQKKDPGGEDAISMTGKHLPHSALRKRWERYTRQHSPKTDNNAKDGQ
jgi:hypothetical protein